MWIDTHTHFNHQIFDKTRRQDWEKAQSLGVSAQFMMSVVPDDFARLEQLSTEYAGTYFALGIQPLFITSLDLDRAIIELREGIERNLSNPRFIGIGEIGLDGFVDDVAWDTQMAFFVAQLKLARDYDLPVFLHVRKAQDIILKQLRRFGIERGIAHAFNGSEQQAQAYLKQGFKLGFGGAFTFERAKKLRRLVKRLPLDAFVLETDCPDMAPAWVYKKTNYSYYLPEIARCFASIRGISESKLSRQITANINQLLNNPISIK